MSISKEDLLRQLEEIERAEADEDASQSLEKPKGKIIRVVQAAKRTKNPKQQERTPAQKEATRKMLEARKKKLAEKKETTKPKEDEVIMVIEPPKKPRKPYTRKPKAEPEPEPELKPPPLKRSTNRATVISDDESEGDDYETVEEELPPLPPPRPKTASIQTQRYQSHDRRFR